MQHLLNRSIGLLVFAVLLLVPVLAAAEGVEKAQTAEPPPPPARVSPSVPESPREGVSGSTTIGALQQADVPSEVSGIVETYHFDVGQLVKKGQVVAEISKKDYTLAVEQGNARVEALEIKLGITEEKLKLAQDLLSNEWGTRRILVEAKENVAIVRLELTQAKKELELARWALSACVVKAPFTGYMAVRYKKPYESVNRLEKLFLLLDTSKVYAAANIAESELPKYKIGAEAVFKDRSGKDYVGTVHKIAPIINPQSHTARIYILIDNPDGILKAGMTGHTRLK